jgi:hypothetical protein
MAAGVTGRRLMKLMRPSMRRLRIGVSAAGRSNLRMSSRSGSTSCLSRGRSAARSGCLSAAAGVAVVGIGAVIQTSNALGAAASMLGARAVALATQLNKELGLSPQKTSRALASSRSGSHRAGWCRRSPARQERLRRPTKR